MSLSQAHSSVVPPPSYPPQGLEANDQDDASYNQESAPDGVEAKEHPGWPEAKASLTSAVNRAPPPPATALTSSGVNVIRSIDFLSSRWLAALSRGPVDLSKWGLEGPLRLDPSQLRDKVLHDHTLLGDNFQGLYQFSDIWTIAEALNLSPDQVSDILTEAFAQDQVRRVLELLFPASLVSNFIENLCTTRHVSSSLSFIIFSLYTGICFSFVPVDSDQGSFSQSQSLLRLRVSGYPAGLVLALQSSHSAESNFLPTLLGGGELDIPIIVFSGSYFIAPSIPSSIRRANISFKPTVSETLIERLHHQLDRDDDDSKSSDSQIPSGDSDSSDEEAAADPVFNQPSTAFAGYRAPDPDASSITVRDYVRDYFEQAPDTSRAWPVSPKPEAYHIGHGSSARSLSLSLSCVSELKTLYDQGHNVMLCNSLDVDTIWVETSTVRLCSPGDRHSQWAYDFITSPSPIDHVKSRNQGMTIGLHAKGFIGLRSDQVANARIGYLATASGRYTIIVIDRQKANTAGNNIALRERFYDSFKQSCNAIGPTALPASLILECTKPHFGRPSSKSITMQLASATVHQVFQRMPCFQIVFRRIDCKGSFTSWTRLQLEDQLIQLSIFFAGCSNRVEVDVAVNTFATPAATYDTDSTDSARARLTGPLFVFPRVLRARCTGMPQISTTFKMYPKLANYQFSGYAAAKQFRTHQDCLDSWCISREKGYCPNIESMVHMPDGGYVFDHLRVAAISSVPHEVVAFVQQNSRRSDLVSDFHRILAACMLTGTYLGDVQRSSTRKALIADLTLLRSKSHDLCASLETATGYSRTEVTCVDLGWNQLGLITATLSCCVDPRWTAVTAANVHDVTNEWSILPSDLVANYARAVLSLALTPLLRLWDHTPSPERPLAPSQSLFLSIVEYLARFVIIGTSSRKHMLTSLVFSQTGSLAILQLQRTIRQRSMISFNPAVFSASNRTIAVPDHFQSQLDREFFSHSRDMCDRVSTYEFIVLSRGTRLLRDRIATERKTADGISDATINLASGFVADLIILFLHRVLERHCIAKKYLIKTSDGQTFRPRKSRTTGPDVPPFLSLSESLVALIPPESQPRFFGNPPDDAVCLTPSDIEAYFARGSEESATPSRFTYGVFTFWRFLQRTIGNTASVGGRPAIPAIAEGVCTCLIQAESRWFFRWEAGRPISSRESLSLLVPVTVEDRAGDADSTNSTTQLTAFDQTDIRSPTCHLFGPDFTAAEEQDIRSNRDNSVTHCVKSPWKLSRSFVLTLLVTQYGDALTARSAASPTLTSPSLRKARFSPSTSLNSGLVARSNPCTGDFSIDLARTDASCQTFYSNLTRNGATEEYRQLYILLQRLLQDIRVRLLLAATKIAWHRSTSQHRETFYLRIEQAWRRALDSASESKDQLADFPGAAQTLAGHIQRASEHASSHASTASQERGTMAECLQRFVTGCLNIKQTDPLETNFSTERVSAWIHLRRPRLSARESVPEEIPVVGLPTMSRAQLSALAERLVAPAAQNRTDTAPAQRSAPNSGSPPIATGGRASASRRRASVCNSSSSSGSAADDSHHPVRTDPESLSGPARSSSSSSERKVPTSNAMVRSVRQLIPSSLPVELTTNRIATVDGASASRRRLSVTSASSSSACSADLSQQPVRREPESLSRPARPALLSNTSPSLPAAFPPSTSDQSPRDSNAPQAQGSQSFRSGGRSRAPSRSVSPVVGSSSAYSASASGASKLSAASAPSPSAPSSSPPTIPSERKASASKDRVRTLQRFIKTKGKEQARILLQVDNTSIEKWSRGLSYRKNDMIKAAAFVLHGPSSSHSLAAHAPGQTTRSKGVSGAAQ